MSNLSRLSTSQNQWHIVKLRMLGPDPIHRFRPDDGFTIYKIYLFKFISMVFKNNIPEWCDRDVIVTFHPISRNFMVARITYNIYPHRHTHFEDPICNCIYDGPWFDNSPVGLLRTCARLSRAGPPPPPPPTDWLHTRLTNVELGGSLAITLCPQIHRKPINGHGWEIILHKCEWKIGLKSVQNMSHYTYGSRIKRSLWMWSQQVQGIYESWIAHWWRR